MEKESKLIQIPDTCRKEIILPGDMSTMFRGVLHRLKQPYPVELLVKKGEDYKVTGLEMRVFPDTSSSNGWDGMYMVNIPEFAKEVLTEIGYFRLVHGNIYRICDEKTTIATPGEYLVALKGEPRFTISSSQISRYIIHSMVFGTFDGRESLSYVPQNTKNPEYCPDEVKVDVSTLGRRDNVLFQLYREIMGHHEAKAVQAKQANH